ncbi:MAG: DUF92 domain-containing protein [Anaerolineales bacterium]
MLTRRGALAAGLLGAITLGLGGWRWAGLLLAFFVTSSALSLAFASRKRTLNEKFAKGSRRDAAQVIANGGLAGVTALAHALAPEAWWPWVMCAGALAAVNADTWATEIGVLSRKPPRWVTNGRVAARGASGAVTALGLWASLGGAALLGVLGAAGAPSEGRIALGVAVTLGGLAGSLLDSLLGATIQAVYYCPQCDGETEHHPRHTCGTPTTRLRGFRWLENDRVNLAAALCGALVAWILWGIL